MTLILILGNEDFVDTGRVGKGSILPNPRRGVSPCKLPTMTTITFDTFKFVDRLEKAGATRELAAAMADAHQEAFAQALDTSVATRADLASVKSELKADIASVRADLHELELRLTIKLGAFIAAAVGILISVLRVSH